MAGQLEDYGAADAGGSAGHDGAGSAQLPVQPGHLWLGLSLVADFRDQLLDSGAIQGWVIAQVATMLVAGQAVNGKWDGSGRCGPFFRVMFDGAALHEEYDLLRNVGGQVGDPLEIA